MLVRGYYVCCPVGHWSAGCGADDFNLLDEEARLAHRTSARAFLSDQQGMAATLAANLDHVASLLQHTT